jgi:hypothetical protein
MLPITDESVELIILITSFLTSNYITFLLSPKWISLAAAVVVLLAADVVLGVGGASVAIAETFF